MKSIWKFDLETTDVQLIKMPEDAQILTVQCQFDKPKLWCMVSPDNPMRVRRIRIVGTGHDIKDNFNGKYIATYQMHNGSGIFHVFDCGYD